MMMMIMMTMMMMMMKTTTVLPSWAYLQGFYGFKHPMNCLPKTVVKCNKIQCKCPQNPKPPESQNLQNIYLVTLLIALECHSICLCWQIAVCHGQANDTEKTVSLYTDALSFLYYIIDFWRMNWLVDCTSGYFYRCIRFRFSIYPIIITTLIMEVVCVDWTTASVDAFYGLC